MRKLPTIALIGHGYWGSKLAQYTPAYFNCKYYVGSTFDLDTIWNDKEITGVIIATPIDTHYNITKQALLAGKHVFVEKPLTTSRDEAEELVTIANNNGLQLGVDYTQTFTPAIRLIRTCLHEIGNLRYIDMKTTNLGRFKHDVFWMLGVHHLSILDQVFPLHHLNFSLNRLMMYNKRCTSGLLEFSSDDRQITGQIFVSINNPTKQLKVTFYGDNGTLIYNPVEGPSVSWTVYSKLPNKTKPHLVRAEQQVDFDESNNLKYSIQYFRKLIDGMAESNAQSAAQITTIVDNLINRP
jgi:predicted dehydrogenase